ncbi:MAG TPA: DUF3298 and DUF4163 domain-containing protein [Negativicutes bacterium]|nr:DUF3298 and DUF4163 domain-containing protein [Negativicutes bacterium]
MKKIIPVFAILLVTVLGFLAYLFFTSRPPAENQQQNQQKPQEIVIEDKKIIDHASPLTIEISYPFINGAEGFNQKVKSLVDAQLEGFKEFSLENDAAVKETDPESYVKYPRAYDLKISYENGEVTENMISILFSIYSFTGGAHGNGYFAAINWDIKNNKEITLADMFAGQPDYLKKVSDYAIADIERQMVERTGSKESGWLQDGAGPKEENFQAFLVKPESITFYFSPYQVAAYAVGDFKVIMPR